MNETTTDTVTQIVRYLAIAAGSGAITRGYTTADELSLAAGALVTLGAIAWGVWRRVRAAKA
jgi:hypothetical protein